MAESQVDVYTSAFDITKIQTLDSDINKQQFRISQDCTAIGGVIGEPTCTNYDARMAEYSTEVSTLTDKIQAQGTAVEGLISQLKVSWL